MARGRQQRGEAFAIDVAPGHYGGDVAGAIAQAHTQEPPLDVTVKSDAAEWAVRLSRPGTVIVCDNVVREGRVLNGDSADGAIRGTRALFDYLAEEGRLTSSAIQTVGRKGWDGFAIAVVD